MLTDVLHIFTEDFAFLIRIALEVKFTARGQEANFRNTVVAPGDLFIFVYHLRLKLNKKVRNRKGCMHIYVRVHLCL